MDAKALRVAFAEKNITRVKIGGFDIDGVLRGKYVSLDKFWSILDGGLGFCDVVFGWDIGDTLYDNAKVTGWSTGYPDAHATIDPSTFRVIPWEPGTAALLLDFSLPDGTPHPACPRSLLKSVLARAKALGYSASFAVELEFYLFKETPHSLEAKGFRGLESLSPGMFGYSWVREGQNSALCHAIQDEMAAFDIPIEALHTETGPGVYEVALRYDDALRMAAIRLKTGREQARGTGRDDRIRPGGGVDLRHQAALQIVIFRRAFLDPPIAVAEGWQRRRAALSRWRGARPTEPSRAPLPRRADHSHARAHGPLFTDDQQL